MASLMLTAAETQRYSRHLKLPEVGAEGQARLKRARVLLVGAGGLGSAAAPYLAAAGVGTLCIIDNDRVDVSNLQRQVMHGEQNIGELKVHSAEKRLRDINPHVHIKTYAERLTPDNAAQHVEEHDIVVDGSDNFATRYLLNDACVLAKKPLVSASIQGFEGQLSVFDAVRGPCYRCLYKAPPDPTLSPSCAEAGVLGVLPGLMGILQATEVLKLLLGQGTPLVGRVLNFDALDMRFYELSLDKDAACVVCGPIRTVRTLQWTQEVCTMTPQNDIDITPTQLAEKLKRDKVTLIDVREQSEWDIGRIEGAKLIPLGEIESRAHELNKDDDIVLYCKMGGRSRRALDILQASGFKNLKNLAGGIIAWSRDVDSSVPQY